VLQVEEQTGQLSAEIHPDNEKAGQRLTAIRMEAKRHAGYGAKLGTGFCLGKVR
jgi:hypothetical protein